MISPPCCIAELRVSSAPKTGEFHQQQFLPESTTTVQSERNGNTSCRSKPSPHQRAVGQLPVAATQSQRATCRCGTVQDELRPRERFMHVACADDCRQLSHSELIACDLRCVGSVCRIVPGQQESSACGALTRGRTKYMSVEEHRTLGSGHVE
jgi:hypothetical protein